MMDYDIPLFTNRWDATSDPYPTVEAFGQKVEAADTTVIMTSEYNYSISVTLKTNHTTNK
jgi:NAD(P)H-dependent FMN reductase